MNVYLLSHDEAYGHIMMVSEKDREWIDRFHREELFSTEWIPLEVVESPDDVADSKPLGDFPGYFSHIPVFSQRAVDVLKEYLEEAGELLPLRCEGEQYYILNVTRFLPALDEDKSELGRLKSGKVYYIKSYVFNPIVIGSSTLFKLSTPVKNSVFATDAFVECVRKNNLTGFSFPLLWSDKSTDQTPNESLAVETGRQESQSITQPVPYKKMTEEYRQELKEYVEKAHSILVVGKEMSGESIVEKIKIYLSEVNLSLLDEEESALIIVSLGLLWGEQIHKEVGWEWVLLPNGDSEAYGLLSPNHKYGCIPIQLIHEAVLHQNFDKVILVYNMILFNNLPNTVNDSITLVS